MKKTIIPKEIMNNSLAYVTQEAHIFEGTIAEKDRIRFETATLL